MTAAGINGRSAKTASAEDGPLGTPGPTRKLA